MRRARRDWTLEVLTEVQIEKKLAEVNEQEDEFWNVVDEEFVPVQQ